MKKIKRGLKPYILQFIIILFGVALSFLAEYYKLRGDTVVVGVGTGMIASGITSLVIEKEKRKRDKKNLEIIDAVCLKIGRALYEVLMTVINKSYFCTKESDIILLLESDYAEISKRINLIIASDKSIREKMLQGHNGLLNVILEFLEEYQKKSSIMSLLFDDIDQDNYQKLSTIGISTYINRTKIWISQGTIEMEDYASYIGLWKQIIRLFSLLADNSPGFRCMLLNKNQKIRTNLMERLK